MSRKYRGLVVVVAIALLLGLADRAFSYRLANFATTVVGDLIAEVAELTAPPSVSRQTAIAPARSVWDASRFQFPSAAEFPAAFSAFGYGDQPWISLGTPLVIDLDSTRGDERPGPTSTMSFQNPSAGQRNVGRRRMAGSGGVGSGGAASGGGAARLMSSAAAAIQGPQAEADGASTSSADVATAPAVDSLEAALVAELWPDLRSSGRPGGSGGSSGVSGSGGALATDPNQTGAGDGGVFGDIQDSSVSIRDQPSLPSPSDLIAPGSLSEALALDSSAGGPGLDVPAVSEVSAVLDVPGTAPSGLGLDWLRNLRSEGPESEVLDLSPVALAEGSPSPENAVAVISEPAMMAVFGVGLMAVAGRLRSKLRRALS